MKSSTLTLYSSAIVIVASLQFLSCGKEDPGSNNNNNNGTDCSAFTVSATSTAAASCNNGAITVTASGGSGISYKLNATGAYQPSGSFTGVAPGAYTVYAKSSSGCEKSTTVNVESSATRGAQFTAMKNLVTTKCTGCHNGTAKEGGQDFTIDCNIVEKKDRIKVRAVDEGTMPATGGPLSAAEKAIIVNWINGGGTLTN